jgi:restriction system protein
MKNYYRVMAGKGSSLAEECFQQGFVGVDYGVAVDLTGKFPDDWRQFNREFIPVYLQSHPEKTRIAAGSACGALWTLGRGMQKGDVVFVPDGEGSYHVGEVTSDYQYQAGKNLPHRRQVRWYPEMVRRDATSPQMQGSTRSTGTIVDITGYANELEKLLSGKGPAVLVSTDETVENPSAFALEKHLEDFLVANWKQTELGKNYDIYEEDGELTGQQYQTDTGPIDILAISKDKTELLVVELKKGRASDVVVGQTLRYMGYVQDELREPNQKVSGIIIALEDDPKLKRALAMTPAIQFFRYEVSFKLHKA